jgi:hypothetical protein
VSANPPVISSVILSGGNFVFAGSGGVTNGTFYVLTSTNVALPRGQWTLLSTNQFDANGNFAVTNAVDPAAPQTFYLLQL